MSKITKKIEREYLKSGSAWTCPFCGESEESEYVELDLDDGKITFRCLNTECLEHWTTTVKIIGLVRTQEDRDKCEIETNRRKEQIKEQIKEHEYRIKILEIRQKDKK
jgi:hypothetical protein